MIQPTSYGDVNRLLDELLQQAGNILAGELVGFYIDGSLALGDFDPDHSDVDFLVVTRHPLPDATVATLAGAHQALTHSQLPFATDLEGAYIPVCALRRYDPRNAIHPNLERGRDERLRLKHHHSDWIIHRHIVREHGITVFGPPAKALIDPLSPDELRAAVAELMRSWWATPEAADSIRQSHPGYLTYVVQTMCRAAFTWETSTVTSKPAACHWALANLEAEWRPLIERAARWELDSGCVDGTLRFVQNIFRRIKFA